MPRNIELKARLADFDFARATARRLATSSGGTLHQIDTYFRVPSGRLKLREIIGQRAELIGYHRSNSHQARASEYRLEPVSDAAAVKSVLDDVFGTRVVVDKLRELWFYKNVRIHLDQVRDLGAFLEFEAVLSEGVDESAAHAQLEFLCREFQISPSDVLPDSYSDLLSGETSLESTP